MRAVRARPTDLLAVAALPAFAPAAAPFLAHWHWSIDLLACFPVQAGGCLWLVAAALLVARRWWLGTGYLVGGLCAAAATLPGWRAAPAPPPGPGLRVAALNLLRGNEAHAAAALATVRSLAPDVLFLSEVTPAWAAALQPLRAEYPHHRVAADPGYFGTALFARWPLRDAATLPLGVDWAPALRAVVQTPTGDVGVLGVHTPRPGGGGRCRSRDLALAAIPAALAPLPPARVVLGDFNATPWNHGFAALLRDSGLDPGSTRAFRPTWPAALPWPLRVPIDHVLVGGPLQFVDGALGAAFGSDHLPLAADLRLPGR